jgi:fatty acid-binding protein DegV
MFTELSTAVRQRLTQYGRDAYCYSLPGGFAREGEREAAARGMAPPDEVSEIHLHQRTLLVTDAASDLPADWRAREGVLLLPVKLRNGEISRLDNGDELEALQFVQKHLPRFDGLTQALAPSVSTTGDLIMQQLRESTDFCVQIAMSSGRSHCYANSLTAAQKLMVQCSRERRRTGNSRPFKMWVADSSASFNGHGVLVAECSRLLHDNVPLQQAVQQVDALRKVVKTLVVPHDLALFHRSVALPDAPVTRWFSRSVGQWFDRVPIAIANGDDIRILRTQSGFSAAASVAFRQAIQCVNAGLDAPFVCASYAGDIAELRHIDGFAELAACSDWRGITLLASTMSMTNAAALGAGGLLISFASGQTLD